jgi:heparanase 1
MKRKPLNTIAMAVLASAPMGAAIADATKQVQIRTETMPLVRTIDERFQSFQIGMSHLTGGDTWRSYDALPKGQGPDAPGDVSAVREPRAPADLTNRRLRALTAALGPLYVRYSGTTANAVYFQDNDEPQLSKAPDGYKVVLTRAAWKRGLDFAKAVDAKVVTSFTISPGVRDGSHAWTPRIAAPWLAYTRSLGAEIYAAELFNEPNAPEPPHAPKGFTAAEYARDFAAFRSFMAKAAPDVKLGGPGEATLGIPIPSIDRVSAEQYLTADPKPHVDILSYHFYGAVAERCLPGDSPAGISADRALSEDWLSRPDAQFQKHKELRDRLAPGAPIWITETGGAACGGTRWQTKFLDTFRYLDSHARLAKQGVDAMFTHALISGSNGVIDEKTFEPNADYWAALLWRRLMGTKVLDAGASQPGLRLYAHCLRNTPGGVAVLAINLAQKGADIGFTGPAELYALTAPALESRAVLINERPMVVGADDTLPAIESRRLKGNRVLLAPTSVNFIALPKAKHSSCEG